MNTKDLKEEIKPTLKVFNRKDAQEMADNAVKEQAIKNMQKAHEDLLTTLYKIQERAQEGEYTLKIRDKLSPELIKLLEDRGFSVKLELVIATYNSGIETTISWTKK